MCEHGSTIPEDTLQTQVVFAWMNIRSSLRPNEGTAFDILSSPQSVKWPSLALNNLNVELDHLITRKRGGVWILFFFDDLDKAVDNSPFGVMGYSDDPGTELHHAAGQRLSERTKITKRAPLSR